MKNAQEILGNGHRSILVLGSPKSGKTSFTCSGSKSAGKHVKVDSTARKSESGRVGEDVVLLNIDSEGYLGAVDCGYSPMVEDLSGISGYAALDSALAKAISEIRPLAESGKVQVVGVDLGALALEGLAYAAGDRVSKTGVSNLDVTFAGKEVDWQKVSALGVQIYRAFRTLPCLVVANVHVRLSENNPYKSKMTASELQNQQLARDAISVGGEAAKLAADVSKGFIMPWINNASFILAREVVEENVGTPGKPVLKNKYVTHTSENKIYSVGNRRASVLPPTTDLSLRALLDLAYEIK